MARKHELAKARRERVKAGNRERISAREEQRRVASEKRHKADATLDDLIRAAQNPRCDGCGASLVLPTEAGVVVCPACGEVAGIGVASLPGV